MTGLSRYTGPGAWAPSAINSGAAAARGALIWTQAAAAAAARLAGCRAPRKERLLGYETVHRACERFRRAFLATDRKSAAEAGAAAVLAAGRGCA